MRLFHASHTSLSASLRASLARSAAARDRFQNRGLNAAAAEVTATVRVFSSGVHLVIAMFLAGP
jgi:hypothetical protein